MNTMASLTRHASAHIGTHGWLQYRMVDEAGRVCIRGAVAACAGNATEDALTMAVLRADGHGEDWNDMTGRTAREVRDYLAGAPVTDETLTEVLGPQWGEIAVLLQRADALTSKELRTLGPRDSDRLHRARHQADAAARDHGRTAVQHIETPPSGEPLSGAVGDAVRALAVRDLTGDGFTREHYDILISAWTRAVGRPARPATQRTESR